MVHEFYPEHPPEPFDEDIISYIAIFHFEILTTIENVYNIWTYNLSSRALWNLGNYLKGISQKFYCSISVTFNKEEQIFLDALNASNHIVSLSFKPIPCEHFEGPIVLKIELICWEKWCKNLTEPPLSMEPDKKNEIFFKGLFAYTNYNLIVSRSRGKNWEVVITEPFKTLVYCKYLLFHYSERCLNLHNLYFEN